jgi:hypothetical protein
MGALIQINAVIQTSKNGPVGLASTKTEMMAAGAY